MGPQAPRSRSTQLTHPMLGRRSGERRAAAEEESRRRRLSKREATDGAGRAVAAAEPPAPPAPAEAGGLGAAVVGELLQQLLDAFLEEAGPGSAEAAEPLYRLASEDRPAFALALSGPQGQLVVTRLRELLSRRPSADPNAAAADAAAGSTNRPLMYACYLASACAGLSAQLDAALVAQGLVPALLAALSGTRSWGVKRGALRGLAKLLQARPGPAVEELGRCGGVPAVAALLDCDDPGRRAAGGRRRLGRLGSTRSLGVNQGQASTFLAACCRLPVRCAPSLTRMMTLDALGDGLRTFRAQGWCGAASASSTWPAPPAMTSPGRAWPAARSAPSPASWAAPRRRRRRRRPSCCWCSAGGRPGRAAWDGNLRRSIFAVPAGFPELHLSAVDMPTGIVHCRLEDAGELLAEAGGLSGLVSVASSGLTEVRTAAEASPSALAQSTGKCRA